MYESINFRDFMDGSYRYKRPVMAYTVIPMLALPDMITASYVLLGTLGVFAIGSVLMEKKMMNREMYHAAEKLMKFVKTVLPVVAYAIILYMMFHNPFMRWVR